MGKLDNPFFGNIPPDETVKLVFNLSQGEDERGPWNSQTSTTWRIRSLKAASPLIPSIRMTKATSLPPVGPGHPEGRLALDAERVAPD